jgi:hypothetical protein
MSVNLPLVPSTIPENHCCYCRPRRDLNPCYRLERSSPADITSIFRSILLNILSEPVGELSPRQTSFPKWCRTKIRTESHCRFSRATQRALIRVRYRSAWMGFREEIDPEAFDESKNPDVLFTFNHNPNKLYGLTKGGTLQVLARRFRTSLRGRVSAPSRRRRARRVDQARRRYYRATSARSRY